MAAAGCVAMPSAGRFFRVGAGRARAWPVAAASAIAGGHCSRCIAVAERSGMPDMRGDALRAAGCSNSSGDRDGRRQADARGGSSRPCAGRSMALCQIQQASACSGNHLTACVERSAIVSRRDLSNRARSYAACVIEGHGQPHSCTVSAFQPDRSCFLCDFLFHA